MWNCPNCGRIFKKKDQPHSCKKVPLEDHFGNKEKAKELFDYLVAQIRSKIGKARVVSLPCCIHLSGTYDFMAALPKKDSLEIRFDLGRTLKDPRIIQNVPVSSRNIKNCLRLESEKDIDGKLVGWLSEAYNLRDRA